jgi:hypothetical protein
VTPHQERLFWRGYGDYEVDRTVLDYYLCERTLDDIAQFAHHILSDDADVDEEVRRTDLYGLTKNLAAL